MASGESPVEKTERRGAVHEAKVQLARNLAAHGEGVVALGGFVVQQLDALDGKVLDDRALQIEGKFFGEALRIQVRIESHRGALPGKAKFAAGEADPLCGDGLIGHVGTVDADGLAGEEIGQGFVGAVGIAQGAGSQQEATGKVLVQFAFDAEAQPNTGAIAGQQAEQS